MPNEPLQQKVSQLISENNTEAAFELLSNAQLSKLDKKLIILSSQYNRIKEELRLNLIPKDDGERKLNQINMALLELSLKIDEKRVKKPGAPTTADPSFDKRWLWLLALIPIIGGIVYMTSAPQTEVPDTTPNGIASTIPAEGSTDPININQASIYQLQSKATEQLLGVAFPDQATSSIISGLDFIFTPAEEASYFLELLGGGGMVASIPDHETMDGLAIQLMEKDSTNDAQKFELIPTQGGYTQIVSTKNKDLYLGIAEGQENLVVREGNQEEETLFKLSYALAEVKENEIYTIQSKAKPSYLEVSYDRKNPRNNDVVIVSEKENTGKQGFKLIESPQAPYFCIEFTQKNKGKGLSLDIYKKGTTDGTRIQLYETNRNEPAQQFRFLKAKDGYVRIASSLGDNLFLGVSDDGSEGLILREGDQGDKTLFKVIPQ